MAQKEVSTQNTTIENFVTSSDDIAVIKVGKEINTPTGLKDCLDKLPLLKNVGQQEVYLDLSQADWFGASAVGNLVNYHRRCEKEGIKLNVLNASESAYVSLYATNVHELIPLVEKEEGTYRAINY